MRAPKVLAVCDDTGVIGAPFYVMERIPGEVITDSMPDPLDNPEQRGPDRPGADRRAGRAACRRLDHARAGGVRQADRLPRAPAAAVQRAVGAQPHARDRPRSRRSAPGWPPTCPSRRRPTIVHGDYRLGNTMFAPSAPARLIAILDWEMATIGDPLADVGYMMMHWTEAGDRLGKFNLHTVTRATGLPQPRSELVARYEQRSGRSMQALDWYVTLALWKAVVFMEGNYKRAIAGSTDDPYLKTFGEGVVELADRARGGHSPWLLRTGSYRRAARRLGRRPDDQRVRLLPRLLRAGGARAGRDRQARSAMTASRELLIGLETGQLPEEEFEPRFAAFLGVAARGLIDRLFAGSAARRGDDRGRAPRPRGRHPHRADLELVGNPPLRPRAAGRAVRRRRDLRRGRDPQAGAGDLRARRGARSGWSRRRACSSTTCRSTSSPAAALGMATVHHRRPRRRSPSSNGCSASLWDEGA